MTAIAHPELEGLELALPGRRRGTLESVRIRSNPAG